MFSHTFYQTNRKAFLPLCCCPEEIKLSFCTLLVPTERERDRDPGWVWSRGSRTELFLRNIVEWKVIAPYYCPLTSFRFEIVI